MCTYGLMLLLIVYNYFVLCRIVRPHVYYPSQQEAILIIIILPPVLLFKTTKRYNSNNIFYIIQLCYIILNIYIIHIHTQNKQYIQLL